MAGQTPIDFASLPIGIPWCREEDYEAFRAMLIDGHDRPSTWQGFVAIMEKAEQDWKAQDRVVIRVDIDPHTFPGWCAFHGKRIDTQSCYVFAQERVLTKTKIDLRRQRNNI